MGRSAELDTTMACLDEHRVVTLCGPGGVGKTRLATRVSHLRADSGLYPGGARFCPLEGARTRIDVLRILLDVLEAAEGPNPLEQLERLLSGGPSLVVLDNCEQVLGPVQEIVTHLHQAAPTVSFIVTSRASLDLSIERVVRLEPMVAEDATRLFDARRQARGLPSVSADHVRAIVEAVDRLPLAIELAVGRLGVLGGPALAQQLEDPRKVLRSRRAEQPRHQTLDALLDWSWELLEPSDQRVLAWTSVFPGTFTVADVEGLLHGEVIGAPDILDTVQRLHDHSLLHSAPGPDGAVRLRLLQTVRVWLGTKLDDAEQMAAQEAHRDFILSEAWPIATYLVEHGGRSWTRRLDNRTADLLAIHERFARSAPRAAARAALCANTALATHGSAERRHALLASAVELLECAPGDQGTDVDGLLIHARLRAALAQQHLDLPAARRTADSVFEETKDHPTSRAHLTARLIRALFLASAGSATESYRALEDLLADATTVGDDHIVRRVLLNLPFRAIRRGEFARAEELLDLADALAARDDDATLAGHALSYRGVLNQERGLHDEALRCHQRALAVRRQVGGPALVAGSLILIAHLAQSRGHYQEVLPASLKAREAFERAGVPARAAFTSIHLATGLAALGRSAEARDALRLAWIQSETAGTLLYGIQIADVLAAVEALDGHLESATRWNLKSRTMLGDTHYPHLHARLGTTSALLAMLTGDDPEPLTRTTLASATESGRGTDLIKAHAVAVLTAWLAGDAVGVEDHLLAGGSQRTGNVGARRVLDTVRVGIQEGRAGLSEMLGDPRGLDPYARLAAKVLLERL